MLMPRITQNGFKTLFYLAGNFDTMLISEIQIMLSFAFLVYDHLQKLPPQEEKRAQQVPKVFFKAKVGQD